MFDAACDCDLIATIFGGWAKVEEALPMIVVDPVDTELMTSFDVSFPMIRTLSFGSTVTIGDCERITGWGIDDNDDAFIIGFICVEPTFIVGVDCWAFFTNNLQTK